MAGVSGVSCGRPDAQSPLLLYPTREWAGLDAVGGGNAHMDLCCERMTGSLTGPSHSSQTPAVMPSLALRR